MTIHYKCEHCGAGLKIKDELAGTQGACPKCKEAFTVPEPENEASEERVQEASPAAVDGGDEAGAAPPDTEPRGTAQPDEASSHEKLKAWLEDDAGEPAADSSEDVPVPVGGPPELEGESDESASAAARAKALMGAYGDMKRATSKERKAEKRRKSSHAEAEIPSGEPGFDYAGMAGYVVTRVLPAVGALVGLFLVTYWVALAMYGPKLDLPPLGKVTGTVTLDGEPLQGAQLMFHPVREEGDSLRASSSIGTTDDHGRYSLSYREGVAGAAVSTHLVEIRAPDETGGERLPPRYFNVGTPAHQLTEKVQPGDNTIDFELTSDP